MQRPEGALDLAVLSLMVTPQFRHKAGQSMEVGAADTGQIAVMPSVERSAQASQAFKDVHFDEREIFVIEVAVNVFLSGFDQDVKRHGESFIALQVNSFFFRLVRFLFLGRLV